jgi:hypothetical protein
VGREDREGEVTRTMGEGEGVQECNQLGIARTTELPQTSVTGIESGDARRARVRTKMRYEGETRRLGRWGDQGGAGQGYMRVCEACARQGAK